MQILKRIQSALRVVIFGFAFLGTAFPQQIDPSTYSEMRWRLVGPFRGGRTLTAVGVPGNPNVFYSGAVGGGVWKSTDAGNTWDPIFDSQPIASIGAIAVAPSDPNVIYVGSGEADMRSDITYGNGVYKSTDAGKIWTHIGLEDSRQIGRVIIDPKNSDVVFVAALGHAYGPNSQRGVFRSTDGGKSWSRVLYKDDDTGAIDLAFDPTDSRVIYASLWQTRRPPWNVYPPSNGPGSGLYKSTDGGTTWQHLEGNGLPSEGLGHIGIAVAPTEHNRVYLIVDAKDGGLYRSDDAGKNWTRTDNEARLWGRGWYFGDLAVDPKNADIVYVANTSTYKSTDGGKSFTAFKGAPGGDDYQGVWISPDDSNRIILASDQGTIVTLNGGKTWSSWYNQPIGQFYHVITDNRFPYWIYGAQQDSGAMSVPSRTDFSAPTERDWRPVGVGGESGSIAPDPTNPKFVFGGTVSRFNVDTMQNQNVSPTLGRPGPFRTVWTLPIAFSMADPHKLYFSHQTLFRTTNGGKTWDEISPDLTREDPGVPPTLDPITAKSGLASPRKGVIYAIAPSPIDANLVWVGTDDGLIHVTRDDGKHWQNVTPKEMTPWSKVGIIEASRFFDGIAYAAVDRHRMEDLHPYIYRTPDLGKTWTLITKGIPEGAYVNVVREDPEYKGVLYAGTELGVYVSFNDGKDWQSLQLNLPVASVRDIAVHGDDLVVGTHGRAIWILDNVTPLRQLDVRFTKQEAYLFKPAIAYRLRPGSDQGTPYPPEIPHGENPPDGAILDYYLNPKDASSKPVTLEVIDSKGTVVRRFASDDKVDSVDEKTLTIPMYWIRPQKVLSDKAGMHRWVWDLHYASASSSAAGFRRRAGGVWAAPGQYTVRLTANGKQYTQPLIVKLDPRIKVSDADIQDQFAAAQKAAAASTEVSAAVSQANVLGRQLRDAITKAKSDATLTAALQAFSQHLTQIAGRASGDFGGATEAVDTDRSSLRFLQTSFSQIQSAIESADNAPTPEQLDALAQRILTMDSSLAQWKQLLADELPKINVQLRQANLGEIGTKSATP